MVGYLAVRELYQNCTTGRLKERAGSERNNAITHIIA